MLKVIGYEIATGEVDVSEIDRVYTIHNFPFDKFEEWMREKKYLETTTKVPSGMDWDQFKEVTTAISFEEYEAEFRLGEALEEYLQLKKIG